MDEDEEESITDDTRKWRARGSNGSKMERYQLFSMHSPALQDLLNNPASVLVVTRRHVLHSWGFTGRRKPPAVQKKEKKKKQGAPPTVCELVQKKKNHPLLGVCFVESEPGNRCTTQKGEASMRRKQCSNFNSRARTAVGGAVIKRSRVHNSEDLGD